MPIISNLIEMFERLFSRVTSKRLLTFMLSLFYLGGVIYALASVVKPTDIILLVVWGILFVVLPLLVASGLIYSYARHPVGDDMIQVAQPVPQPKKPSVGAAP